jgi:C-terminal processing protease CtpA/Prc
MKNKKILAGCIILLMAVTVAVGWIYKTRSITAASKNNKLTKRQKLEDFNYVYNILKDNFPYFEIEKRKTGFDWLVHKKEFEKEISKTKSNDEFYLKMDEILKLVQNAHTHIFDYSSLEYSKYIPTNMTPWVDIVNNEEVKSTYETWIKYLNSTQKSYIVPLMFHNYEGKYTAVGSVFNTCDYYGISEGSILTKVNDVDIDEYIKTLMRIGYLHYDSTREVLKLNHLIIKAFKQEEVKINVESPSGEKIEKRIKTEEYEQDRSSSLNNNDNLYTEILTKDKSAYMKVKSFEGNYIFADSIKMYDFLRSIKDYSYLIVDIRGNGGGSDGYWGGNIVPYLISSNLSVKNYLLFKDGEHIQPFIDNKLGMSNMKLQPISELPLNKNYPKEIQNGFKGFISIEKQYDSYRSLGFKGKIYLLVDDYVYSSAESFAAFAKASKWATLVGTETGGDGIGIDPALAVMPNSKLVFRFSMDMGLNPDGTANEETHTKPDIYVEQSYADALKNIKWRKEHKEEVISPYDTVLNKILDIIK